jgi:beta-phosphoglucomutase-like phosphatase (HAD superfamily)
MRELIFDLDVTLVDAAYAHVFAWQEAFVEAGISPSTGDGSTAASG